MAGLWHAIWGVLIVGAPGDDGAGNTVSDAGAVYMFAFQDAEFAGARLTGVIGHGYVGGNNVNMPTLRAGDKFGSAVALDGRVLVVGVPGADSTTSSDKYVGAAHLFTFNDLALTGGVLRKRISQGVNTGASVFETGLRSNDLFGTSIALRGVNEVYTVAVGAVGTDNNGQQNAGKVYVYSVKHREVNSRILVLADIDLTHTISLRPDTSKILDYDTIRVDLSSQDHFGAAVGLANTLLMVGAPGDDGVGDVFENTGAVYAFDLANNAVKGKIFRGATELGDVNVSTLDANDRFGAALAIDGTRVVIGAPKDDGLDNTATDTGAVHTFSGIQGNDLTWLRKGIVIGSGYTGQTTDGRSNVDVAGLSTQDYFGNAVALNGRQVTVGAWGDDGDAGSAAQSGTVFLFNVHQGDETYARQLGALGEGTIPGITGLNVSLDTGDMYGAAVSLIGNSIAISALRDDGSTNTVQDAGAVYMYELVGPDARSPELRSIIGKGYSGGFNLNLAGLEAGDLFGSSLVLTQDNLVVGAIGDDGRTNTVQNAGAVYYFQRRPTGPMPMAVIGSGYYPETARPQNMNISLQPLDAFGSSIAATDDMLFVGAEGDDGYRNRGTNSGAVYVFGVSKGSRLSFNQASTIGYDYRQPIIKTSRFTGSNAALDFHDSFGSSMSIIGNTLAVGAIGDDGYDNAFANTGAVHLFKIIGQRGDVVKSHAMIGRGYAQGNDVHIDRLKTQDAFGKSVSLGEKMLVIGAPLTDGFNGQRADTGAVYRVRFDTPAFEDGHLDGIMTYGASGTHLTGGHNTSVSGLDAGDRFGRAVSLDGNRLFVGALNDDGRGNSKSNTGRVYSLSLDAAGYQKTTFVGGLLQGSSFGATLAAGDQFGSAVALSGKFLAIGARSDDGASNHKLNSGAVHLYNLSSINFGGLRLKATLGAGYTGGDNLDVGNLDAGDRFGSSIAMNNGRLVVGAVNDDGRDNISEDTGAIYMFSYGHSTGSFLRRESILGHGYGVYGGKYRSIALDPGDKFGKGVALDARILAVGAPGDDGIRNFVSSRENGAVHIFSMQTDLFAGITHHTTYGAGYSQARKGLPRTGLTIGRAGDTLGMSVALSGTNLVIGAPGHNGKLNQVHNSGAVHMIRLPDNLANEPTVLGTIGGGYSAPSDIQVPVLYQNDLFGYAVALDGDQLVVGAPKHDGASGNAIDTGAVYRFAFADQRLSHGRLVSVIGNGYTGTPNSTGAENRSITVTQTGDMFGVALALQGARLVIGASGDDGNTNRASSIGRVYNVQLSRTGAIGNLPQNAHFGIVQSQDFTLTTEVLERLLSSGDDVHLKANNDILVAGAISVRNDHGDGGDFTLTAGRTIKIFSNIKTDNGNFTALANAGAAQGVVTSERDSGKAHLVVGKSDAVNAGSGTIRLELGSGSAGDLVFGVNSRLNAARVELLQAPGNTYGRAVFKSGSKITATSTVNSVVISAPFFAGTLNAVTPDAGRVIAYKANGTFAAPSNNMIYGKTIATLPVTALPASTGRVTVAQGSRFSILSRPGNLVTGDGANEVDLADTLEVAADVEDTNPDLGIAGVLDPEFQTGFEEDFDFGRYALVPILLPETTQDTGRSDAPAAAPQGMQDARNGFDAARAQQRTFQFITQSPRRNSFRSVRSRSVFVSGGREDTRTRRGFLLCLGSAQICGEEGA